MDKESTSADSLIVFVPEVIGKGEGRGRRIGTDVDIHSAEPTAVEIDEVVDELRISARKELIRGIGYRFLEDAKVPVVRINNGIVRYDGIDTAHKGNRRNDAFEKIGSDADGSSLEVRFRD